MNEDYQYPLMGGLSDDEVVDLMTFYQRVEDAYERPAGLIARHLLKRTALLPG